MSLLTLTAWLRSRGGVLIGSVGMGLKPLHEQVDDLDACVVMPSPTDEAVWEIASEAASHLDPSYEARVEAWPKCLVIVFASRERGQSVDLTLWVDDQYGHAVCAAYTTARKFLCALDEEERKAEDTKRKANKEGWYRGWNIPTSGRM